MFDENDTDNESNRSSSTDQNTWSAAQALLNLGQKSSSEPLKVCVIVLLVIYQPELILLASNASRKLVSRVLFAKCISFYHGLQWLWSPF